MIELKLSDKMYIKTCQGMGYYEVWFDDLVYVGSSKILLKRIFNHRSLLRKGAHPNAKMQCAYNSTDEVIVKIFFTDDALAEEVRLTKIYKKMGISLNGDIGNFRSEETKRKISLNSTTVRKLLDNQILEIRKSKLTHAKLSKMYNVGVDVIHRVLNYKGAYKT